MKRLSEKINNNLKENKLYYLLVLFFFCVGIVIGVYIIKYMNESDKTDLAGYFTQYVNGVSDKPVDYGILLFSVIKKNLVLIIPIILCAFTFFGSPIVLLINLVKGFTIGYTFGFLLTTYQGKGIGLALIATIPQNLIYIPFYIAISTIALSLSTGRLKERFSKKIMPSSFNFNGIGNYLIILLGLFVVGVIVETYLSPSLIKFVVTKFYL